MASYASFAAPPTASAEISVQAAPLELTLLLSNRFERACTFSITDGAYGAGARSLTVNAGERMELRWPIAASHGWYDLQISVDQDAVFYRRICGHVENGLPSRSDPVVRRRARSPGLNP